jgi:hypothetical protein
LVSVNSDAEQSFVEAIRDGISRWIGYSKLNAGEFTWITGETSTYEHWQQGDPNEQGDACARLREDGQWSDRPCNTKYGAICERE